MKCIICDSETSYYFSKSYSERLYDDFIQDIGEVDYIRCNNCGFVLSKTHSELSKEKWDNLNHMFHHSMESHSNEMDINQPPYAQQAMMIAFLGKNKIINAESMVDYAAGYGSLSNILNKYHDVELPIYDLYVQGSNSNRYIDDSELGTYKTVINSAMFEHILKREDIEQVNNIVDNDGCLIIHTVVCENVPKDPNWFYLQPPVHTAFHTNKSMNILMEQWNYKSSIYCPQSKCWVLLRANIDDIESKVESLNHELQSNWFFCKSGFMDYWKGF